ncbi:hypothetical protein HID58_010058, partial [Brassica napus]
MKCLRRYCSADLPVLDHYTLTHQKLFKIPSPLWKNPRSIEETESLPTGPLRILLDALEPLTLESMVDFSTGEEVPITFQYEKIANFCKNCNMLTHTSRYCTRKAPNQSLNDQQNSHYSESHRDLHVSRRHSSQSDRQVLYSPRLPPPVRANNKGVEIFHQRVDRHGKSFGDRVTSEISQVRPLKNKITPDNSSGSPPKMVQGRASANQERKSVKERLRLPPPPQLQWRVRERQNTPPIQSLPLPMQELAEPQPILGPLGSSSGLAVGSKPSSTTGAKRRGRPPGAKKTHINAMSMGGSAKKMIFSKVQASPARTNSTPSSARRARATTSSSSGGTEIKVWTDAWISTTSRIIPYGPLKEGTNDLYVSDLINRGTCEWNIEMISRIMPDFVEEILTIKPSKTEARDSYIWYPAKSGIYSAKSGYAAAIADKELVD